MRRLTLIRHAKSSWDYAELADFERPLNARGRRDATAMAQKLAGELERPLQLVSSPALRAITTAHTFADAMEIRHSGIRIEPRIYEATRGDLLELVRELDDAERHVVLFGHNPGMSEFAALLAQCPLTEMPTCAVITLCFEIGSWRELQPGDAVAQRYEFPKKADG